MSKAFPHLSLFLILIALSILFFIFDSTQVLNYPKRAGYFFTNPISFGLYNTKQRLSKQFFFIFASRSAAQEYKALQEQTAEILSENAQLKRRLAETEAQVIQQSHLDPRTYNLISARPLGLQNQELKIDRGSKDGIKIGQAIVFKDNYIGQIISVSESGSTVKLLQDPESKVAAFSLGKDGKGKGVLSGQFGLELLLDKILHEEPIAEGDLVYSEGTEGFLPRGLVLGRVTQVLTRENEVFKQAKVTPVFDIRDLDLVFAITN